MEDEALQQRMQKLGIREEDLLETFVRGSGSGGQKLNKTSSTVILKHVPSGLEVRCQAQRSQHLNRLEARRELCEKMEQQRSELRMAKQAAMEKIKRRNRRRPFGLKEQILKTKHRRSEIKRQRQRQLRPRDIGDG